MKKYFYFGLLLFFFSQTISGQSIDYCKVKSIINAFISESPTQIADFIEYPLKRRYPLPSINNKQEFIDYFLEIFDSSFIQSVGNSNANNDWIEIGWRGVMFQNGNIWLSDNYLIKRINYESVLGKSKWQELVDFQKNKLPIEYQNIDNPIYEWNSEKYHYRLDEIKGMYRLMIWDKEQTLLKEIYENGMWEFDGNIGFFHIDWNTTNKTLRIQNYGRNGDLIYTFLKYELNEIANNEDAQENYIDVEIK